MSCPRCNATLVDAHVLHVLNHGSASGLTGQVVEEAGHLALETVVTLVEVGHGLAGFREVASHAVTLGDHLGVEGS